VLLLELLIELDDELDELLLLVDAAAFPVVDAPMPKLTRPTMNMTAINSATIGAFHHARLIVRCAVTGELSSLVA
jgi:hypothetical protein